jgi:hypothetical protein
MKTLTEWKKEVLEKVRTSKIYLCPAAHKFIADPKRAGSKDKYISGCISFLKGAGEHGLAEDLEEIVEAAKAPAKEVEVKPEVAPEPKSKTKKSKAKGK